MEDEPIWFAELMASTRTLIGAQLVTLKPK